jgi:hypothetical protein
MSTDLSEGLKATTAQGGDVTITLEGGPKVNGAVISGPGAANSQTAFPARRPRTNSASRPAARTSRRVASAMPSHPSATIQLSIS